MYSIVLLMAMSGAPEVPTGLLASGCHGATVATGCHGHALAGFLGIHHGCHGGTAAVRTRTVSVARGGCHGFLGLLPSVRTSSVTSARAYGPGAAASVGVPSAPPKKMPEPAKK